MIFQNFSPKQRQAMLWWAMPESKQAENQFIQKLHGCAVAGT